jgi:hypothetical protein
VNGFPDTAPIPSTTDPRKEPATRPLPRIPAARTPGGTVPRDDDLLEPTLAFSGTYVSDDGTVAVRRSVSSPSYSGARFTAYCAVCSRAGLIPATGEPVLDLRAAVRFVSAHDHGERD